MLAGLAKDPVGWLQLTASAVAYSSSPLLIAQVAPHNELLRTCTNEIKSA
jgi:hypothetical protein